MTKWTLAASQSSLERNLAVGCREIPLVGRGPFVLCDIPEHISVFTGPHREPQTLVISGNSRLTVHVCGQSAPTIRITGRLDPRVCCLDDSSPDIGVHGRGTPVVRAVGNSNPELRLRGHSRSAVFLRDSALAVIYGFGRAQATISLDAHSRLLLSSFDHSRVRVHGQRRFCGWVRLAWTSGRTDISGRVFLDLTDTDGAPDIVLLDGSPFVTGGTFRRKGLDGQIRTESEGAGRNSE